MASLTSLPTWNNPLHSSANESVYVQHTTKNLWYSRIKCKILREHKSTQQRIHQYSSYSFLRFFPLNFYASTLKQTDWFCQYLSQCQYTAAHCRTLFRCVFSLANTHKGMHAQTHTCKPLLSCTICYLSSQWVPVAYFPLLPLTDLMGLDALSDNWSLWNWSMEVPFVFQLISSLYLCVFY